MANNTFTDPRAVVSTYVWPENHHADGEDETGIERTITTSATTSGVGLVRQQGADTPQVLTLRGDINTQAHHDQMVAWAKLCRTQTIYFTDFDGNSYEVIITSFKSRHAGVASVSVFFWTYTLSMEVIDVLAGDWN